jgi:peptidoglycan/LPS O-acetylase OafA/YrhL
MEHTREEWLDGIRGLAALVVVFGHCGNFGINVVPGIDLTGTAKAGVWLFFALSAYLLTDRMLRQIERLMPIGRILAGYVIRRFFRIMPAYILLLLALWGVNYQNAFDWGTVARHAQLIEGWQHLWTIPVEMKFYAVLPLIVLAVAAIPARYRGHASVGLLIASLVVFVLTPPWRLAGNPLGLGRYLFFFALGIAAYLWVRGRSEVRTDVAIAALVGGAVLFVVLHPRALGSIFGIALEPSLDLYPLSATAGAGVLVAVARSRTLQAWFGASPLAFVGRISFSLYLLHFFVLPIVAVSPLPAKGAMAVLISIAVGAGSYFSVERPFLLIGARLNDRLLRRSYRSTGIADA